MADRRGPIVDCGGVLTTGVCASFRAFCEAEALVDDLAVNLERGARSAWRRCRGDAAATLAEVRGLLT